MIRITHMELREEHILHIIGHAGFSNHGNDIVCAGISALTYALLQTLCGAEERGELCLFDYAVKDGAAVIHVRAKAHARGKLETALETAAAGYQMIAGGYPEHVCFEEMGEKGRKRSETIERKG